MEYIKIYGEKIAVFVVLSAYVDLILPDNSFRKYIRLIFGTILILAVLNPIYSFLERVAG